MRGWKAHFLACCALGLAGGMAMAQDQQQPQAQDQQQPQAQDQQQPQAQDQQQPQAQDQQAAQEGPNMVEEKRADVEQKGREALGAYETAVRLAQIAREERNALGLAAAAQLMAANMPRDLPEEAREGEAAEGEGEPPARSPEALLAEARELAAGNDTLLATLGQVEQAIQSAGRQSINPGCWSGQFVPAGGTITFWETYFGNEWGEALLVGTGQSDIDLWVYDAGGNLICRSTSYGPDEFCDWVPAWTGDFKLVVENVGKPVGSYYDLCTN